MQHMHHKLWATCLKIVRPRNSTFVSEFCEEILHVLLHWFVFVRRLHRISRLSTFEKLRVLGAPKDCATWPRGGSPLEHPWVLHFNGIEAWTREWDWSGMSWWAGQVFFGAVLRCCNVVLYPVSPSVAMGSFLFFESIIQWQIEIALKCCVRLCQMNYKCEKVEKLKTRLRWTRWSPESF